MSGAQSGQRASRSRRRWTVVLVVGLPLSIGAIVTVLELFHGVAGLKTGTVHTASSFSIHTPPPNTQLLWLSRSYEQVPDSVRLHAYDWNGREIGTAELPCQAPCGSQASPDGQRILVRPLGQTLVQLPTGPALLLDEGGTVFDARGRRIGVVDGGFPNLSITWADDSRHLCVTHGLMDAASTGSVQLDLIDPTAASSHVVTTLAASNSFQSVVACNPGADRAALLTASADCTQLTLSVVQLSTGKMLLAHSYPSSGRPCAATPLVRHDGAVAIESTSSGGIQSRDLTTGTVEPLPMSSAASAGMVGLSWNGRRLVTTTGVIVTGGGFVWTAPPGDQVDFLAARPKSDDVLLFISGPAAIPVRQVIIHGDGSEVALPGTPS